MAELVEVVIDSIRVSLMSSQRVVVLRQTSVERFLPIWIGPFEAENITMALQEVEVSRPLTHDLLKNVFIILNARIVRIEISELKGDIYYSNIIAEQDGKEISIDSRASDAIALAVRAHVPMLVNQAVMDDAGILPEKDLQQENSPDLEGITGEGIEGEPGDAKRLDVFEDFLKKLGSDKTGDEPPTS